MPKSYVCLLVVRSFICYAAVLFERLHFTTYHATLQAYNRTRVDRIVRPKHAATTNLFSSSVREKIANTNEQKKTKWKLKTSPTSLKGEWTPSGDKTEINYNKNNHIKKRNAKQKKKK